MNAEQIQEYVNNAIREAMQQVTIAAGPDVQMDAAPESDSEDGPPPKNQELDEIPYELVNAAYELTNPEVRRLHGTIPNYQHPRFKPIETRERMLSDLRNHNLKASRFTNFVTTQIERGFKASNACLHAMLGAMDGDNQETIIEKTSLALTLNIATWRQVQDDWTTIMGELAGLEPHELCELLPQQNNKQLTAFAMFAERWAEKQKECKDRPNGNGHGQWQGRGTYQNNNNNYCGNYQNRGNHNNYRGRGRRNQHSSWRSNNQQTTNHPNENPPAGQQ
ncbi:hypothetical protein J3B02_002719 [Coemansia erecta]|nr:hypothetical protein J3B02_002719 [Coemansia erecta]